jgi:hypothetical protein
MVNSRSLRCLSAASLCAAAMTLAACDSGTTTPPPPAGPTTAPAPSAVTAATQAVTDAANDAVKAAQAKIDEVAQYIKDNKLDAADKALTELETNKASLPADIQAKLPELRTLLDTAKKAAAVKLPG